MLRLLRSLDVSLPHTADSLDSLPVTALKGVGPKSAERLARLGIHSVQDVLFHLPLRYQDRTRIVPIGSLRSGDQAVIEGDIDVAEIRFGKRRSLLVSLSDGTGRLMLRFFHFSAAQKAALAKGVRLRCFGEVRNGPASYELVHPEYEVISPDAPPPAEQSLTPIYPTTEGMHQLTWRDLTEKALARLAADPDALREWLPEAARTHYRLPALGEALRQVHRPPPVLGAALMSPAGHPSQHRLAFEELLAHQLSLRVLRARSRQIPAPPLRGDGVLRERLRGLLPFTLTGAQARVLAEIEQDQLRDHPMLRLVQGDVGSGKTVVAALAALQAIEAHHQVALMAPTELLAEQHRINFENWLVPLGIEVGWLSGRQKGKAREAVLARMASGELAMVVGTHALFQDDVAFAELGLVIVDEQHRFGVHQRLALREKSSSPAVPHQLVMTATPIPRTLAMTAYADLDLSVIDELPPGRTPVQTVVLANSRRAEVVVRVEKACAEGRQAYWVCTLIEESEVLQCQAAEEAATELAAALPALRIGLVHGRLKARQKAEVMAAFKAGALDLLVATTVIEVGVDVPNASLMIIENAERLGLAQLHQLRGRVGRGAVQSHCVLMYHPPLGKIAQQRLAVLRDTNDGFVVAQKDLEIRGPGEVLGTRQTGEVQFRVAELLRDQALVPDVQQLADELLAKHPRVVGPLIRRWVGHNARYADV